MLRADAPASIPWPGRSHENNVKDWELQGACRFRHPTLHIFPSVYLTLTQELSLSLLATSTKISNL
jgi:hypothetical protein